MLAAADETRHYPRRMGGASIREAGRDVAREDNARIRRRVIGWTLVVLIVVGVIGFAFVRRVTRALDEEAVPLSYLEAVQQERWDSAYDLLCDDFQSRISRTSFTSANSHDVLRGVDRIGPERAAAAFGEQRGPFRVASYTYPVSGAGVPADRRVTVLVKTVEGDGSCVEGLEFVDTSPTVLPRSTK